VHVADALAHEVTLDQDGPVRRVDEDHLRRLGVLGSLPEWRCLAEQLAQPNGADAA